MGFSVDSQAEFRFNNVTAISDTCIKENLLKASQGECM